MREAPPSPVAPAEVPVTACDLTDRLGRPLRDLRISVTDRCNFRCRYCMPREHFGKHFLYVPRRELLTFEELTRLTRLCVRLGARKIRLTGGEPLLRADIERLVGMLAELPGVEVALTTNGVLLSKLAGALASAGLKRVTVSLDSLDEATFRANVDADYSVSEVLAGIEAAERVGLLPIKVNAVIRRGVNDDGMVELARYFKGSGHIVRFIEYMDVGATNGWRPEDVVTASEIIERLHAQLPLEPLEPSYRGEVARRWRYTDGAGEIGVIASVSSPFCGDCTRARLSADGKIFSCLFASVGTDLRAPLRDGADDEQLLAIIGDVWRRRSDRYSELRLARNASARRIEMSYIGG